MSNIISKHRPKTFKAFIGSSHQIKIVKDDLASNDITQTWMIVGAPGFGKTTLATILARKLLALSIDDDLDKHPDFTEHNANEDGSKETIINIIQNTKFLPKRADYKVILIDEMHKLSGAAVSALLKATEKPPKHVIYIFATSEHDKVLPTLRQRAKMVILEELTEDELVTVLTRVAALESMDYATDKILRYIASRFVGRTRLALHALKDFKTTANKQEKINIKDLEQAVERAVQTDYALGGGILENLYLGKPADACQLADEVKDMHHVVNTLLDLNNAVIQNLAGVKTYSNDVRKKLWKTLRARGQVNITHALVVQDNLFKLKENLTVRPMLDSKQLMLYYIASSAVALRGK